MRFVVLGPVRVVVDGQLHSLPRAQTRGLLALLLLNPGRELSRQALIDALWNGAAPATAPAQVHNAARQVRSLLAQLGHPDVIESGRFGYRIAIEPGAVDSMRFERLIREGRAASDRGEPDRAGDLFRAGLELFTAQPLLDASGAFVESARARLTDTMLTAVEDLADLDLRHARPELVATELAPLVHQYPLRERLRSRLMLALYRSGRKADALRAARAYRKLLVEQECLDPGSEITELEGKILRSARSLDLPPNAPATPAGSAASGPVTMAPAIHKREAELVDPPQQTMARLPPDAHGPAGTDREGSGQTAGGGPAGAPALPGVPMQLPADVSAFTGRAEQLVQLDAVLANSGGQPTAAVISALSGTAGAGKTALAVHWAHRVRDRYPDGQLFIDLHGHTQGMEPVEPSDALDRMLRALGIPGPQIPEGMDERAALYRTRLADQRVLVVLDNAASEAQVAPLVPGTSGSVALVTSRRQLALDHTQALSLDVLPVPDAVTLFSRLVDNDRIRDHSADQLTELVQLCGRLPLAIRIAAARLRSHPSWQLSHLVERLLDQRQRLGELSAGQRSVTAALDLSYQHLSPQQRQAYQLLGLHPGSDVDAYATAALLDSTLSHAGRVLDQLLQAHLLQEPTPGRYQFHDLTRAHAARTATADDDTPDAALERLLNYYRHTAAAAMNVAHPYEAEHRPQVPPARTPVPGLPDPAAALSWLDSELPNLLATAQYATEHTGTAHVLQLSTILHRHLVIRGSYRNADSLHQQALTQAVADDDQAGRLTTLNALGDIYWRQGRYEQAADHYQQALQIARATGHRPNEQVALHGLGDIHWRQGRCEQAADHYQQALRIARATGHRPGELTALSGLGDIQWRQGRYEQAADHYQQALQIARATGHRPGEQWALTGLGHVYAILGRHAMAADHYQQALRIARATGNRPGEQNALNGLGYVHRSSGRYEQAADCYGQALEIARATGHCSGVLNALGGLGDIHRLRGRHTQAHDHYRQMLDLAQESGERNWQFEAWQGLGRLRYATGDPDSALAHHRRALAIADQLAQTEDEARAHDGLAHAHHALNQHEQARQHWQLALDILTEIGIDDTDGGETSTASIQTHLTALTSPPSRRRRYSKPPVL